MLPAVVLLLVAELPAAASEAHLRRVFASAAGCAGDDVAVTLCGWYRARRNRDAPAASAAAAGGAGAAASSAGAAGGHLRDYELRGCAVISFPSVGAAADALVAMADTEICGARCSLTWASDDAAVHHPCTRRVRLGGLPLHYRYSVGELERVLAELKVPVAAIAARMPVSDSEGLGAARSTAEASTWTLAAPATGTASSAEASASGGAGGGTTRRADSDSEGTARRGDSDSDSGSGSGVSGATGAAASDAAAGSAFAACSGSSGDDDAVVTFFTEAHASLAVELLHDIRLLDGGRETTVTAELEISPADAREAAAAARAGAAAVADAAFDRALAEAAALRAANPAYASIVLRNLPFSVDSDEELRRMLAILYDKEPAAGHGHYEKEPAAGHGVIVAARSALDPSFPARHRKHWLQLGLGAHLDCMTGKGTSEALTTAPAGAALESSRPASASGDHHDSAAVGGAGAAPSAAAAPAAYEEADSHCRDERDPCSQRYRGVATFSTAEHAARAVELLHSMRLPDSCGVDYYHRPEATNRYRSSVEPPSSVAAATARAGATAALAAAVARSASEEAAAVESDSQACELCRLHVELVDDSPPVPAGSREARPRPLPVLSHWRPPVAGAAGGQAEAPQAPQAVAGRDYFAVIVHGFLANVDAALLADACEVIAPPLSVTVQAFPARGLADDAAASEGGSDADENADAHANADAGEEPMPDDRPRAGTARAFATFASAADAERVADVLHGMEYNRDGNGNGAGCPLRACVHVGDPPVWAVAGMPPGRACSNLCRRTELIALFAYESP